MEKSLNIHFQLSPIVIAWSIWIIVSALFMRQILTLVVRIMGHSYVAYLIWLLFGILFLPVVLFELKRLHRVLLFSAVFLPALFLFSLLPVAEERFHFLEFGILGWMIMRENSERRFEGILVATMLGLCVAAMDESLQLIIPWRVGDVRDILFGTAGSLWGALSYAVSFLRE